MKNRIIYIITFGIIITMGIGCKKNFTPSTNNNLRVQTKPPVLPKTPSEIELVKNISKVGEVFKELYKKKENIKVVNASIFSHIYTDESILLKDLIYPVNSRLNKSKKFNELASKWKISLNSFANQFWELANKKQDNEFLRFLNRLSINETIQQSVTNANRIKTNTYSGDGSYGNDVSVYQPYSENFEPVGDGYYNPLASVVTATEDADEGTGYLPYYNANGEFQYYTQVLINDDWCEQNPTHIIGVNGIEPIEVETTGAPSTPVNPPGVNRVYIGEAILKHYYDVLISFSGNGGGSEIKFCRISGYLQPVDGQVTSFQDIVGHDFSRKAIRRGRLERIYAAWDMDWQQDNNEQVLAIYEDDNRNSVKFNGSLSTTLTVTIPPATATRTGSIGFSIEMKSDDEIIRQLKISRNSYFVGAFQDQGWGFVEDATFLPLPYTHGWPVYDGNGDGGANLVWTWPYNVIQ